MTDAADWGSSFGGSGMQVYEDVLVERMFDPWGGRLLDQVGVSSGAAVLDVACGPGTVARLAAQRVGPSGSVTGCDLNAAMLAIAESKPVVETGASITYVECAADALGALDASFGDGVAESYCNGPWGFPDSEDLGTEIEAGGFGGVRMELDTIPVVFEGGVEQLLSTLAVAPVGEKVAALGQDGRAALVDALTRAASAISDGDAIRSDMACNTAIATC